MIRNKMYNLSGKCPGISNNGHKVGNSDWRYGTSIIRLD